jgi:predicted transcriptional regulator of viral defense system
MADRGGRYQICGPNAFNRYGFSDQVPNRVYAYNNRLSGERTIGAISLTLIKVADTRLGDTEESTTREGLIVAYSSRVRTLVDAVYDWARFGSLPRGYVWVTRDLAARRVTPKALVAATLRYGDVGTIRRMGALLEKKGANAGLVRKLEDALPESTGTIPWIPTLPKRGTLDRRWRLIMNGEV